jgi:hypothetical protein
MRRLLMGHSPKAAFFAALYMASVAVLSAQSMMKSSPPQAAPPAAQPATPASQVSVAGTIRSMSGSTIFVAASEGGVTAVEVGSGTLILGRKAASLDSIQPGEALGVAATRADDGSLTATDINIFTPQLWQIVRKGQFPMANGQVMTNAQVDKLGAGVEGKTLYLKYEMLTAAVAVPDGAEIRRSVALKLSDLKPGQKVMVRGSAVPGGALTAALISFDLPG